MTQGRFDANPNASPDTPGDIDVALLSELYYTDLLPESYKTDVEKALGLA